MYVIVNGKVIGNDSNTTVDTPDWGVLKKQKDKDMYDFQQGELSLQKYLEDGFLTSYDRIPIGGESFIYRKPWDFLDGVKWAQFKLDASSNTYVCEIEACGFSGDDVELKVVDDNLSVVFEKEASKTDTVGKAVKYSIALPDKVKKIKWSMVNGLLTLSAKVKQSDVEIEKV